MPLTLTIEDLRDGLRAMMTLAQWKSPSLALNYQIGRVWKSYKKRVTEADEMQRDILREFGATEEKQPDGNIFLKLPTDLSIEDRKVYDEKIKEMNAVEMEVAGIMIAYESLEKYNAPFSGDDFSLLGWLIAEPVEVQAEEAKPIKKKARAANEA